MKKLLPLFILLLIAGAAFAQRAYTKEEGLEFGRLVKLTKEYNEAVRKADEFNMDSTKIPQEVVFLVERKPMETDNIVTGVLKRKLATGMAGITVESYTIKYDRLKKKIISIEGGENKNVIIK